MPHTMPMLHVLATCLAVVLAACGPDAAADTATADTATAVSAPPSLADSVADVGTGRPYRFDEPVARFELPGALVEISALTVLDADHLGAVEDEDGDLYVLSVETGEVVRVVPFGPPGDYEGIERVGERLFVLRADGAVLELSGWSGDAARSAVYETGLGAKACDAEGLGADARRLLIACKKPNDSGLDPVYAFDLATMALVPEPVLSLDRGAVPGEGKLRVSAIAVHPVTGQTVALSSARGALVVLDADGGVADVWDLSPAALVQPEGLAFLPNGDLFVSSEGRDGRAVLVRFAYDGAGR